MWVSLTDGSLAGRIAWWNPRLHVRPRRHDRLRLLSVPKEDQEDGKRHVRVWLMWQDIPEEQFPAATQIRAHRYGCAACYICSSLHLTSALVGRKGGHMLSLSTGEMCSTFYFSFLSEGLLDYLVLFWRPFSSQKNFLKKKAPQTWGWILPGVNAAAIAVLSISQGEVSHIHTSYQAGPNTQKKKVHLGQHKSGRGRKSDSVFLVS